jgi:hypothetical protein
MPERSPFPFVIGCGRSGTTLVRALLDAHPAFAVPDESYFPVWFARERARYERDGTLVVDRLVDDLIAHESFGRWGLDADRVRREICAAAPTTFADGLRAYYASYACAHGKPRYADKTPIFVLHIPVLAALFPEAVFIHMVRDGRDVVLSRTEAAWGSHRFDHETLQWRNHIEKGRADGARLGARRYREFHYEALLDDPEETARSLCEFVGADFDPVMLRYHESAQPLIANMAHPDEHQNVLRPPTKGLRDWRSELSADQVAYFEQLAGRALRDFGYEPGATAASPTLKAKALTARARYASQTQYRRARRVLWHAVHSANARS